MKRFFMLISMLAISVFWGFAQENDQTKQDTQKPAIADTMVYKTNQAGDQYIVLKLNLDIPYRPLKKLKLGGAGSLGYQRFLTDSLNVGGDISFAYSKTIGNNVFYFVPFIARIGWQFTAGKFEFPLSFGIGGALQNYIDRTYFGLVIRPEFATYYRYNADWSFGLHTGLYIMPQWYKNKAYNYTGIIHDIGLTVRYHF